MASAVRVEASPHALRVSAWLDAAPSRPARAARGALERALAAVRRRVVQALGDPIAGALEQLALRRAAAHEETWATLVPPDPPSASLATQFARASFARGDTRGAGRALLLALVETLLRFGGPALAAAAVEEIEGSRRRGPGPRPGGDRLRLEVLLEACRSMAARRDVGERAAVAIAAMDRLLGVASGALLLATPAPARLSLWHRPGASPADRANAEARARSTALEVVAQEAANPSMLRAVSGDLPLPPLPRRATHRAAITLPLVGPPHDLLGFLQIDFTREAGEADLAVLGAVATQLAESVGRERTPAAGAAFVGEDLEEAQRQVVAAVAHDVRNSLGAILVGAAVLSRRLARSGVEGGKQVEVIDRGAKRIGHAVQNLVDSVTLDTEPPALELRPHRLEDLLREGMLYAHPLAEGKGIRVEVEPLPALPAVLVDRARAVQVLANLFLGVARLASRTGVVRVAARREGSVVTVVVTDLGPALSQEDLRTVFERRHWIHHAAGLGAGLGLVMARRLVELHGGTLTIRANPSDSNDFVLRLPATRAADGAGGDDGGLSSVSKNR